MKHGGLGRGLDALLPQDDTHSLEVREISVDEIDVNTDQPRKSFDEESLQSLADSIQSSGVLSPLIVVESGLRYRIVAGERRFRAAKMAGLSTVPCIVRDMTDAQQMEAALIENLQREDLNPIEEASAIQCLMKQCGYTQDETAQKLGKSRPNIANMLRLLNLPEDVQSLVKDGTLSAGHARVLAGIDDDEKMQNLLNECLTQNWSVRELELQASSQKQNAEQPVKQLKSKDISAEMQDFINRLRGTLGMKVQFSGSEKKGKITLSFQNREELEHLYQMMERISE